MGSCLPRVLPISKDLGIQKSTNCQNLDHQGNLKSVSGYRLSYCIGKGTMGKVKLARNIINDDTFAIKVYNKTKLAQYGTGPTHLECALREVTILKTVSHPNVVSLIEVINEPHSEKMYLVLENISGGPIMTCDNLFSLPEARSRLHFIDITKGLEYLHARHIVHRDVKPDNCLYDLKTNSVKLCDFSSAQFISPENSKINCTSGSPYFFPPELCKNLGT
eukprot:TRINITY_DN2767_c0_g3_i3.p1 TRINITY_DN2767_c0_g3~~TRINITY_DN2767_c0_g3_i3.p1  ORF type:complete len:220 (-),score=10.49 TRINITY_DN2767_c0_g3_i3:683-1342(-)